MCFAPASTENRMVVATDEADDEQEACADESGATDIASEGSFAEHLLKKAYANDIGATDMASDSSSIQQPLKEAYADDSASTDIASESSFGQQPLQPLKEVKSDPLIFEVEPRSRTPMRPLPASMPLLYNGLEDWPWEVRRLLVPSVRHKVARGDVEEWARPAVGGLRLFAAAFQIPHPRKAESGGEDSFFVSKHRTAVGIADGVGEWGWRFRINPRAFAEDLMSGAASWVDASTQDCLTAKQRAASALREGFASSKSFGSATTIVASLDDAGTELGIANLGDAGLRQVRHQWDSSSDDVGTRIVGCTTVQQHSFNCPYQLSCLPEPEDFPRLLTEGKGALVRAVKKTPSTRQDDPSDAQLYSFPVQEGDLIILGSDGVFDNLHNHEVCQLAECTVSPFEARQSLDLKSGKMRGSGCTNPVKVAEAIAQAAFCRSRDPNARTPFSANAREAGLSYPGGKMDDITVVAAWAVRTCCE